MKTLRQMKILEIIRNENVETQEHLAEKLRSAGIEATQATVSRDIRELRLIRAPNGRGKYRYAMPADPSPLTRMRRYFRDSLLNLDHSENIVVIKCLPGTAPAVGSTVDSLGWPEIVGTVAGDDTILVVARSSEVAPQLVERLRRLTRETKSE
ncbi:MAG: arginine repressor [Bacillota bacterium]